MLLLILALYMQLSTMDIQPLAVEKIDSRHGLSQNSLFCTYQDSKGYLWIGTQNGLFRHDGYETRKYSSNTDSGLGSDVVRRITNLSDGTLWVLTDQSFLSRYDYEKDRFETYPLVDADGNRVHWMLDIFELEKGKIWVPVGRNLGKFYYPYFEIDRNVGTVSLKSFEHLIDHASISKYSTGEAWRYILRFTRTADGELWASSGVGIFHIPKLDSAWTYIPTNRAEFHLPATNNRLIVDGGHNSVWIASSGSGILKYNKVTREMRQFVYVPGTSNYYDNFTDSMLMDSDSTLLVGSRLAGLFRFNPATEKFTSLPLHVINGEHEPKPPITELFKDRTGVIWISSLWKALYKVNPGQEKFQIPVEGETIQYHLKGENILSLYTDYQQHLWVGTEKNAGFHFNEKGALVERVKGEWPPVKVYFPSVYSLLNTSKNELFIGTSGGVFYRSADTKSFEWITHTPWGRFQKLYSNHIFDLEEDFDGSIVAGNSGVNRIHTSTGKVDEIATARITNAKAGKVNDLFLDSKNRLWAAATNGLFLVNRETNEFTQCKVYPRQTSKETLETWHISEDKDGIFHLGTEAGWFTIADPEKENALATKKTRIPNISVFSIKQSASGGFWITTSDGLYFEAPGSENVHHFTKRDGIVDGTFTPSKMVIYQNKLLAASVGGIQWIDPDYQGSAPSDYQVAVTSATVYDKPVSIFGWDQKNGGLVFEPQDDQFTFRVSAFDYRNPEGISFEFLLEGGEDQWREAIGGNIISYSSLPAGFFKLKVRGKSPDGLIPEQTIFAFTRTKPYYQRVWFLSLVVLIVFSILAGFVSLVLQKRKAVEQMREQIVSDMHDDISSTIASIKFNLEVLKYQPDLLKYSGSINTLMEASVEAAGKIRDLMWTNNPESDAFFQLSEQFKKHFHTTLAGIPTLNFSGSGSKALVRPDVKRDAWLVFKEMLTNILKHSDATAVTCALSLEGSVLKIEVEDNGRGFDLASKKEGIGRNSIKRRVEKYRGSFEIESAAGKGCYCVVKFPNAIR